MNNLMYTVEYNLRYASFEAQFLVATFVVVALFVWAVATLMEAN